MRKSEGENKPDAHFHNDIEALPSPKLIHTAHIPSNSPLNPLSNNLPNNATTPPPIEFHTAIDICFEIYLQIIYIAHDIVITPSCFTTCASTCASRSNQEVVKK